MSLFIYSVNNVGMALSHPEFLYDIPVEVFISIFVSIVSSCKPFITIMIEDYSLNHLLIL